MAAATDIGSLIDQTPDVCGGRPRIAGTGVSVRRIVGWHQQGLTPEEIVQQIPHLTMAQVHAALAYYYTNRERIDAEVAAEDAEADQLERQFAKSRSMP